MDDAPFTLKHAHIWFLSSMGIFLDGFDLFVMSIALPLIIVQFAATPLEQGIVGAAAVVGAIFGALIGGRLCDRFGRKKVFLVDLFIFIVFAVLSAFAWNIWSLILFRFLLGVGIGADYPVCASYVSEFMPKRIRGRMLIAAFSFQAVGIFAAAGIGLFILAMHPSESAWRGMLVAGAIPAIVILILRRGLPESARWHIQRREWKLAMGVVRYLIPDFSLKEKVRPPVEEVVQPKPEKEPAWHSHLNVYAELFSKKNLKRTVLITVPWFFMDFAFYGVGIFTPILIASMIGTNGTGFNFIAQDFYSSEYTVLLDVFLVLGFILNILFVERVGRIRLQLAGFVGMAAGMFILAASQSGSQTIIALAFVGFGLFNLLQNWGPNATTFLLPAELFPTRLRATAHGFAAGIAKVGAACGIIFVPLMKASYGVRETVIIMGIICIFAFVVTWLTRIDMTGHSLEDIGDAG
ncbi:MFS transporter [uncultured Methanoregula sp.]|uniref:MFS transporter n=1 Tax=uncultured Methanoregula sp. TaxID=1005933 RepID=UPI002AAAF444|nr:MFS transporter [uncultured Methanoregula sp.]